MSENTKIDFKKMFKDSIKTIKNPNNLVGYFYSIAWYFICTIILSSIIYILFLDSNFLVDDSNSEQLSTFGLSLLNFLLYIILLIPMLLFLKTNINRDLLLTKSLKFRIIGYTVSGYLYVLFGTFISQIIVSIFEGLFSISYDVSVNQIAVESMLSNNNPVIGQFLLILSVVIIGPIVEELVFRKAIFGLIKSNMFAVILSSIFFALIHVSSEIMNNSLSVIFISGIPYFVLGCVFGFIYLRFNKNIFIPIFVHMLSNLISIVLILSMR